MSDNSDIKELLEEAWNKRRGEIMRKLEIWQRRLKSFAKVMITIFLGRINHVYMQFEFDHDNLPKALEFCQQSLVCIIHEFS